MTIGPSIYGRPCFWRETMRPARVLVFDARLMIFVLLFMLHLRLWTLFALILAAVAFYSIERRGLSFQAVGRLLRSYLAGPDRPARRSARRRPLIDYGFER
jgi:hypothetical protein